MKLNILLLSIIIATIFLSAAAEEGSLRGLRKDKNIFDEQEDATTTTATPQDDSTTTTTQEESSSTIDDDDNEFIEVDVALDFSGSVTSEDQRQINLALIEALNDLGIMALTEGSAPAEAVMMLNSYTMDETEQIDRRKLGGTYSRVIGPCSRCKGGRRERRDLKKSPSIKKTLEGKLNKILKETKIKQKVKVEDVQYFQFEKLSV